MSSYLKNHSINRASSLYVHQTRSTINVPLPGANDPTVPRPLTCPVTDCRNLIPSSVVMCIRHWAMLPPHIQLTLKSFIAIDQRDDIKFTGAMKEALGGIEWLEKHGRVIK